MKQALPSRMNLRWLDLLPPNDIQSWTLKHKMPHHLHGTLSFPVVYRFVFPQFKDENGSHTPCYVGEAGRLGRRLSDHFRKPDKEQRDKSGKLMLKAGWSLRGAIQRSEGKFALQVLTIEGGFDFFRVVLSQHSFDDPFERRLLENWAIRSSELDDHLHLLNRGISQPAKDLLRMIKTVRRKRRQVH